MIWQLAGTFAVIAVDGQKTLGVSQLSGLQHSNGKKEGHLVLAKTGMGPATLTGHKAQMASTIDRKERDENLH